MLQFFNSIVYMPPFLSESSSISDLATTLLSQYNLKVRPICPGIDKVHVTIDMAVRQLISLVSC